MIDTLKRWGSWFIWEEKRLFKSSTLWLAALLAAAPQLLPQIQADFPTYAPYLPKILQTEGMGWIALAIAVCRLRSMLPTRPENARSPAA